MTENVPVPPKAGAPATAVLMAAITLVSLVVTVTINWDKVGPAWIRAAFILALLLLAGSFTAVVLWGPLRTAFHASAQRRKLKRAIGVSNTRPRTLARSS